MLSSYLKFRNNRAPWAAFRFLSKSTSISAFLFVAFVLYTSYSLLETSVERTRISESALLPNLVDDRFNDPKMIAIYIKKLSDHANNRKNLLDFLDGEMNYFKLDVGRQNFSFRHDSMIFAKSKYKKKGQNVYGIVRAARSAPFESILVVVQIGKKHISSMAFALCLAKYAKEQIYWARDIIFLFVDDDKIGTEAWMSAFYGYEHNFVVAEELNVQGGPIIGAFVLDLLGENFFNSFNIYYGMINGRLPNLDLVNLFILLLEKYGVSPTVYNIQHPYNTYDYKCAIYTVLRAVVSQSFTEIEGLHSVIGGYGVNAITVQAKRLFSDVLVSKNNFGQEPLRPQQQPIYHINAVDFVRFMESGLRSLNNILEKFHQSYFLYILPHSHNFISVAFYMPVIGLLIAPMIFFALYDWIRLCYGENAFQNDNWSETQQLPETEFGSHEDIANHSLNSEESLTEKLSSSTMIVTFFLFLLTHLLSLVFYALQISLYSLMVLKISSNIISGLTILMPPLVFTPIAILLGRIQSNTQYYLARFFVSFEIALFLSSLSLLNFALALSLSVLFVPFVCFVMATGRKSSVFLKLFGFTLLNPVSLALSLCVLLENRKIATFGEISTFNFQQDTAHRLWFKLLKWTTQTVQNHFVHESALFPILSIACLSFFNVLLQILTYENHHENIKNFAETTYSEHETKNTSSLKKQN